MEEADIIVEKIYKWKLMEFLTENDIPHKLWFTETVTRCVVSADLNDEELTMIERFLDNISCSARIVLSNYTIRITS